MAWVKVDDQFPDHPKVVAAGPLAKGLFVDSLCYANRLLTDGFVPERVALRLASEYEDYSDAKALIQKLLAVGLWESAEDGYQIHNYLKYQPGATKIKGGRAAAAQRQQEWRDRHAMESSNSVTQSVTTDPTETCNSVSSREVTPAPYPYPSRTRPVPLPNELPPTGVKTLLSKKTRNIDGFEDFYTPYPRKESRKEAEAAWSKLNAADRALAIQRVAEHLAAGMFSTERQFQPLPATWLNKERFRDPVVIATNGRRYTSKGGAGTDEFWELSRRLKEQGL